MTPRLLGPALSALAIAMVAACGSPGGSGAAGGAESETLSVAAGFYPLQFAVEQVGGEHVDVTGLTKPGVEPHDLELTPRQVADAAGSDLVVYLKGFQPALDEAAGGQAGEAAFDVGGAARLDLAAPEDDHEGETAEEHGGHAEEGGTDPHFWLDPKRYADVGDAIAAELGRRDQENAAAYTAAAADFRSRLEELDAELRTGLARCSSKELVTSHAAFGYLADAYGLHQEAITGLSPESEPSPADLARLAAFVREHRVATIYAETLVSQDVARTLSRETGATLATLDPIEGLTDTSAGKDYFEVMRSNLKVLRAGQGCS